MKQARIEVVLKNIVQTGQKISTLKVLVVDAHQVVRDGICVELAKVEDIELVGESASGTEALLLAQQLAPQVIILDMHLQDMNGVELTRSLRQQTDRRSRTLSSTPLANVLVYSAHSDKQYIWSFLAAGARGYLLKNRPMQELIRGIRQVGQGKVALSEAIQTKLVELMPELNQELSESEQRVLRLLARGFSNREIATHLHISEGTVKSHLSNTYRKIPWIRTRAEAVAWAWINRIVTR